MKAEREDNQGLKRQTNQDMRERERETEQTDMGVKELDKMQIER